MSEEKKTYLIDSIKDEDKPELTLVGLDGNAYSVMGAVRRAWQKLYHSQKREIIKEYTDRATSGDYNNLISVSLEYIHEPEIEDEEDWGDDEIDDTEDWDEE